LSESFKIIGLEQKKTNLFRIAQTNFKIYSVSENSLESIFEDNQIDLIIHAATIYGHDREKSSDIIQTNILLPVRLIELAQSFKVTAFLNIDSFFNHPENKTNYLSEYSLSKKQCLEWLMNLESELKVINLKIFHMYGPGDNKNKFVTWIIDQLLENKPVINLTPGKQLRDFIYIDDVISAFHTVLLNLDSIDERFISVDVGSGVSVSIEAFVTIAKDLTNSNSVLKFGALDYRDNEIMSSKANSSFLKGLNWNPQHTIKQGIMNIIKHTTNG